MSITRNIVGCWSPSLGATGYLLRDVSGRNNHGTLSGYSMSGWEASPNGLILAKTNTTDIVTTTNSYPQIQQGNAVTLIMWGQRLSSSSILFFGRNGVGTLYLSAFSDGNIYSVNGGVTLFASDANTTFDMYAMTQGSGTQRLYRNGLQISSAAATAMDTNPSAFSIGGISGFSGLGKIGECAVFTRELLASEIAELYRRGNGWLGRELTGMNQRRTYAKKLGNRRRRLLCGGMT